MRKSRLLCITRNKILFSATIHPIFRPFTQFSFFYRLQCCNFVAMEHAHLSYHLRSAANQSSHSYLVVVEYCDVATGRIYGAFVPDVPGCTATGASIEQALRHIQTSLSLLLQTLVKQGSMPPQAHTLEEHSAEYAAQGEDFLTERSIVAMVDVPWTLFQQSAQAA
jgi:predicted RNase H-like HicB family nuclease